VANANLGVKYRFHWIWWVALACLPVIAAVWHWGMPRPSQSEYRVGYGDFAPYLIVQPNGDAAGLAKDLFDEAARRLDVRLQWVEMKKGPDIEIPSGLYDLEPILAVTEARKSKFYLSAPWWENNLGLATDADRPIAEAGQTAGKRVGVINGSFGVAMAKRNFPAATIVPFAVLREMLGSVCEGGTDAVMVESRMFQNLWGDGVPTCRERRLTFRWIDGLNVVYAVGARFGLEKDADLFHKQLVEMSFDGTLTRMGQRYGVQATNQISLLRDMVVVQDRNTWLLGLLGGAVVFLSLALWQYFQLRRAKAKAEEASLAKSRFLAMISHEIRTPLNGVMGTAELLRRTRLDGRQQDLLGTISGSGQVLLNVLNDVLDYSKAEAKKLHVERIPFGLDGVLEDTLMLYGGLAEEKRIFLSALRRADVPPRATGDPTRLRQTLGNLVNNALKFTKEGSVEILVERGAGETIRFTVTDTGPGVADNAQELLFQPFRQADTSTTRKFGGTGLGLAICQELVQLMGGRMGFSSVLGKGSSFWFEVSLERCEGEDFGLRGKRLVCCGLSRETRRWLEALASEYGFALVEGDGWQEAREPRGLVNAKDEAIRYPYRQSHVLGWLAEGRLPECSEIAAPSALGGLRVLVAEDNATNRKLVAAYLESLGCEMKMVKNGLEAVEAMSAERFDVVLMDYQMPEMDGLEATKAIRGLKGAPARVPVIGFTAAALEEDRLRCIASGMDEVLTKPLSLVKLETALRNYGVRSLERS
jgi:signal transduction histidine kinase/ActR/RegA family two-component response regulator